VRLDGLLGESRDEKIIGESWLVTLVDPLHPKTLLMPVGEMERPCLWRDDQIKKPSGMIGSAASHLGPSLMERNLPSSTSPKVLAFAPAGRVPKSAGVENSAGTLSGGPRHSVPSLS
jgi:hypothetical protein